MLEVKIYTRIERKLQCFDKLNRWATENGFRFSQTQTKCVHFCHKRKLHNDPYLKLERTEIPVVNEYKFLGLVFDEKTDLYSLPEVLQVKLQKKITTVTCDSPHNGEQFEQLY